MFLGLAFLIGVSFGGPITLDKVNCSAGYDTVLYGPPFSIPLTPLVDNMNCLYTFHVETGKFAVVNVIGLDMQDDEGVSIYDPTLNTGTIWPRSSGVTTFNTTTAWPQDFKIRANTRFNTNMKIQINITLQDNLIGKTLKSQIGTDTDRASTVLYLEDLKEGETYSVSSVRNMVTIKAALADPNVDDSFLNNIFFYQSDQLFGAKGAAVGTMLKYDFTSSTSTLFLYVAKSVALKGAILLTDSSNLVLTGEHTLTYVPLYREDHTTTILFNCYQCNDNYNKAVTVVGEKDGSTPISIRQLNNMNTNATDFSYISGGPVLSDSIKKPLNPRKLPITLSGNLNTIYIAYGYGSFKFSIA